MTLFGGIGGRGVCFSYISHVYIAIVRLSEHTMTCTLQLTLPLYYPEDLQFWTDNESNCQSNQKDMSIVSYIEHVLFQL